MAYHSQLARYIPSIVPLISSTFVYLLPSSHTSCVSISRVRAPSVAMANSSPTIPTKGNCPSLPISNHFLGRTMTETHSMKSRNLFISRFANERLKPDFNKAIHIDIWIARPGAYAYRIEYEPLPDWDPSEEDDSKRDIKRVQRLSSLLTRRSLPRSIILPWNHPCASMTRSSPSTVSLSNLSSENGWVRSKTGPNFLKSTQARDTT